MNNRELSGNPSDAVSTSPSAAEMTPSLLVFDPRQGKCSALPSVVKMFPGTLSAVLPGEFPKTG